MPVLEAVAVGRAIVCSDLPVLRESGGNTATYIDPRGSEEDAANAIVGLIHNLPRIMQRRRALQRFSWGAVVRRDVLPLLNGYPSHHDQFQDKKCEYPYQHHFAG